MTPPDDDLSSLLQSIEDRTLDHMMRVYRRWVAAWIVMGIAGVVCSVALIVTVDWWWAIGVVAFCLGVEVARKKGHEAGDRVALILDPKGDL